MPLLVAVLVFLGCAQTPHIYTMQPSELENIRSEISTIGVYLSPEPLKTEVLLPAKGFWGGVKRGIVVGAAMPVMIGFVSPIPGGTFLGLLFSPIGALIGGVYGATTAVPAREVEHAEVMLEIAADNLRRMRLRDSFVQRLIDLGNARTNLKFVAWREGPEVFNRRNAAQRSNPSPDSIDARLAVRTDRSGLRGMYSIDPPTDIFLQVQVQLIIVRGNVVLLDEMFTCASDQERTFKDWTDQGGVVLIKEFESCLLELSEKIVDDFFRVYPIEWKN